jgi:hypothetical protein
VSAAWGPTRREDGFVATEFALGVGLLLLPVTMLVLTLPTWSERQTTARAMAREAGRAVAATGVCRPGLADDVVKTMARNLDLAAEDVSVRLDCAGGPLEPGSDLEVAVTVRMPAVSIPGIGAVGEWSWTASHREPVDQYASLP